MNEPLCMTCKAPTETVATVIPTRFGDPDAPRRERRRCTQPANHEGVEYYRDDDGILRVRWPA